ncbi:MAG: DUF4347 domain-containing protein [Phormidesmis sp. CAN_BIN44]|nr:DUF4347 domain-containing protein [Phormidesmis sp. CAN_BIN44]
MNSDIGLPASTSVRLSENISTLNSPLASGAIQDPISIGLALTSSSSLSNSTLQPLTGSTHQAASLARSTSSLPTLQVQVAPIDLMSLGMPAALLPQPTSKLSIAPIKSQPPDVGIAPVVPPPLSATITGEIAFVDSSLPNYKSLVAGVRSGVTVVVLEGDRDGIAQITQVLKSAKNISAIHLISPGDAGVLKLGVTELTTSSLDIYRASLRRWASALTPNADILLYGSNVGAGKVGDEFTKKLSNLTATDIAASTNQTGGAKLGGDWNLEKTVLEVNTGEIVAKVAFQAPLTSTYSGVFNISPAS